MSKKCKIRLDVYNSSTFIKIADFGLVKTPLNDMTSLNTEIKGSINDISDLSIVGYENYEIRHETYALAQVIYFILTGRRSNYHREKNSNLHSFINKGMSSKENRYQDLEDLVLATRNLINSLT